MAEYCSAVYSQMNLLDKRYEFERSLASFAVTLAVLEGYQEDDFDGFLGTLPGRLSNFLDNHPRDLAQRFTLAREKYGNLLG